MAILGHELYIGGNFNFTTAQGDVLISVAKWNDLSGVWHSLHGGIRGSCDYDNTVWNLDTDGSAVYFGGSFEGVGKGISNRFSYLLVRHRFPKCCHVEAKWFNVEPFGWIPKKGDRILFAVRGK
jgi:hypothetical protein